MLLTRGAVGERGCQTFVVPEEVSEVSLATGVVAAMALVVLAVAGGVIVEAVEDDAETASPSLAALQLFPVALFLLRLLLDGTEGLRDRFSSSTTADGDGWGGLASFFETASFLCSSATGTALAFLAFLGGFCLKRRVSSLVVTTLGMVTGGEGGGGGDWLLCDELLMVGDGVVDRLATEVVGTGAEIHDGTTIGLPVAVAGVAAEFRAFLVVLAFFLLAPRLL